jgi:hypothetical protein
LLAQLPERAIGHARHRRDKQLVAKRKTEEFHGGPVPACRAREGFYLDCCPENRQFLPVSETSKGCRSPQPIERGREDGTAIGF